MTKRLDIPVNLTIAYIMAHKAPPVSGAKEWIGVPEELGEYLYGMAFMRGFELRPRPADEQYPKIAYTNGYRHHAVITYNDEEGWEVHITNVETLLTGSKTEEINHDD